MKEANPANQNDAARKIIIERIFDVPRELVWEAWTNPEEIVQWWGPNGFTNTLHEMDVRPGGQWRHTMHGPDGTDYPNHTKYLEVVKPERLVYSLSGEDKSPCKFHVTVTFDVVGESDEQTKVTLCMLFKTPEIRDEIANSGAIEGGNQTLGRLAEFLARKEA